MNQIAVSQTQAQVQTSLTRLFAATSKLSQGFISYEIASAKLANDFWVGALTDMPAVLKPTDPQGVQHALHAARERCDRTLQEMRKLNDQYLACCFDCAETAMTADVETTSAAAENIGSSVPVAVSVKPHRSASPAAA